MQINPNIDADIAQWWRPVIPIRARRVEGIGNNIAVLEISRTERIRLIIGCMDNAHCEFEAGDSRWLVSESRQVTRLEWWESSKDLIHWFNPLDEEFLLQEFIALKPTEEAFLGFASQYGFLGGQTWCVWLEDNEIGLGESLDYWKTMHSALSSLNHLWQKLSEQDVSYLEKLIEFDTDRVFFRVDKQESFSLALRSVDDAEAPLPVSPAPESNEEFILRASRELLLFGLSHLLHEHCRPWLRIAKGPQLRLIPVTLIGSMCIMLTEQVLGKPLGTHRCGGCGKQFTRHHARRKYCSNACKAKVFRRNQIKTEEKQDVKAKK